MILHSNDEPCCFRGMRRSCLCGLEHDGRRLQMRTQMQWLYVRVGIGLGKRQVQLLERKVRLAERAEAAFSAAAAAAGDDDHVRYPASSHLLVRARSLRGQLVGSGVSTFRGEQRTLVLRFGEFFFLFFFCFFLFFFVLWVRNYLHRAGGWTVQGLGRTWVDPFGVGRHFGKGKEVRHRHTKGGAGILVCGGRGREEQPADRSGDSGNETRRKRARRRAVRPPEWRLTSALERRRKKRNTYHLHWPAATPTCSRPQILSRS